MHPTDCILLKLLEKTLEETVSKLSLILLRIVFISKEFDTFFWCCCILCCHDFVGTIGLKKEYPIQKRQYFSFCASFR